DLVQVLVSKEKALHNLNRQRALSKKGASTVQELEDCENEYRSASAAYENARATARNVIASAVANRVARNQAIQTLADMIIRVPKPELTPPGSSQADAVVYAVTKRSVSEGQMVREGEAVCELIIENPLRLWTSAPERYAERVRVGQPVRIAVASQPELTFEGKVVRINPSVDPVSRTFQVETQVPNERRLVAGRRLRQGDDHHRLGSPGSRRPDRVDHSLRRRHQAVLRRERQGPVGRRHRHRYRGSRLGRGHEQEPSHFGDGRHHRPDPARQRHSDRDPHPRATVRPSQEARNRPDRRTRNEFQGRGTGHAGYTRQRTNDRWQMTDDRWQMTDDRWQMAEPKSRIAHSWAGE